MPTLTFSLAHWCILIAALLPLVCAGIAKSPGFGKPRRDGGFDNADPRGWLAQQGGLAARANAAQANSFEALPFFIGAVLAALQLGVPPARVDALALAFIVLRVIFIACYVGNRPTLRSAAWGLGFAVNVAILLAGLRW